MKKTLSALLFAFVVCLLANAQPGNSGWLYRVNFTASPGCPEGTVCPQEVRADVNLSVVPDSAYIWMKIGTEAGLSDIYSRRFLKGASLSQQAGVTANSDGNVTISLGNYTTGEHFFVDMEIIEVAR